MHSLMRSCIQQKGAPPVPEVESDGVEEGWFLKLFAIIFICIVYTLAVITHRDMSLVTEELAELQDEITKLQDKVDATIDSRRHIDIEMSNLDRKVKMDKAIAIDQHHQKVQEFCFTLTYLALDLFSLSNSMAAPKSTLIHTGLPCPGSTLTL